ncbi:MAG: 2Fe-2S iron-sulfur cluster-binding protein [Tissierellia bacterium]|nr:2Fe-2S iron-sulfur cluster-binding protein [Tissierellia bacterium]
MIKQFNINDKIYTTEIDLNTSLYELLRKLGFKSVKCACTSSNCGLCTVWVDKIPSLSCSILAIRLSEENKITTLEGVSEKAKEFGKYLSKEGGEQCGFCSPGFIMNVLSMKEFGIKSDDEDQINKYLQGNLCRCSGYMSQLRAVKSYLEAKDEESK